MQRGIALTPLEVPLLTGLAVFCLIFVPFGALAQSRADLPVPFASQAPFGNWSHPWQEFCEEASIVMAAHYVRALPLTPQFADREMRLIQRYEQIVFGRYRDSPIEEVAAVLRNFYGLNNVRTAVIASPEEIKKELVAGRAVIVPTAGRLLKNPFFTPPGPVYHMFVVRGFDDGRGVFIVNDPGTRRGNGLEYNQSVLFAAIHDWNGGDVMRGEKRVMVVGR